MLQSNVRVRFAPSPTGFLHLGGLRTALYNYLFAQQTHGKFILRVEDTDQSRLVPQALEQQQNALKWAGLHVDEGPLAAGPFGPYLQSQRLHLYREHVKMLLNNKTAYKCFCTESRLNLLRKEAIRLQEVPRYDNKCRHLTDSDIDHKLSKGMAFCIRFKIADVMVTFNDLIYGTISHNLSLSESDPVIVKSDGFPTYHFANVVDDHLMEISHVFRGVEWQISTTKHLALYRAFGWQAPQFGHLPLLLNANGTKLSKRQGDANICYYQKNFITPLALVNYIVHSGGGFAKDLQQHKVQLFSLQELSDQFDVTKINSHSGKLMPELLLDFNRLDLKRHLQDVELSKKLLQDLKQLVHEKFGCHAINLSEDYLLWLLNWASSRITRLTDLVSKDFEFVWVTPSKPLQSPLEAATIARLKCLLEAEKDAFSSREILNDLLKKLAEEKSLKFKHFMKSLRLALIGYHDGPSVAEIMLILGKKNTLKRLDNTASCKKKKYGVIPAFLT